MVLVDSQQRQVNVFIMLQGYKGEFKNKGFRSDKKYRR